MRDEGWEMGVVQSSKFKTTLRKLPDFEL